MNLKLLDCTLRDGGYVNDWDFGRNNLLNIMSHLVNAGIDFIEVGFLDQRREFDINRSIMPDTSCVGKIYGSIPKKGAQIVGMIDFGTCDIDHIQPCSQTYLDGIRVIFKKHLKERALAFCRDLKSLGYKVFAQAVSITSYSDEELMELINLANEVKPYALSIVDTYGLLHKNNLFHFYELMDRHLSEDIGIGYHSHNNFQLGYSNCIELMNIHAGKKRMLLCDGSVFGMGKGAGNAPTELLAMYCNDNFGKNYRLSHLLEAVDVSIMDIYRTSPWGYSMKFFIAASNDCHPNYVTFLLDKKTLTIESINLILQQIASDKKLLYDKEHIEALYVDFQKQHLDDSGTYAWLSEKLAGKKLLIIGPGRSIIDHRDRLVEHIAEHRPAVIAINFLPPHIKADYLFLTNSKRYLQQLPDINAEGEGVEIIATSNVTKADGYFDHQLDYETLIDKSLSFPDNSFLMLMRVLMRIGIKEVALAGFDGYSVGDNNYFNSKMDYLLEVEKGQEINAAVDRFIDGHKADIHLRFITPTVYHHD